MLSCTLFTQDFEGEDGGDDNAVIRNPESVKLVTKLLGLETSDGLSFALTTLRNETRGMQVKPGCAN